LNINSLNGKQLENLNNNEINELIINSLFPLENKEVKYFTSNYFSKYEMHEQADRMKNRLEGIISRMKKFYGQRVQGRKYQIGSALDFTDYE